MDPPRLHLPVGVELCRRIEPRGRVVCILINHTAAQTLALPQSPLNVLTGEVCRGTLELAPRQVAVLIAQP